MFAYIRQHWRRAWLYCSNKLFVINDLIPKVEQQGQAIWAELEAEDQTPLVNIRRSPGSSRFRHHYLQWMSLPCTFYIPT